ncbi:MAG: thiosulfate oxidation carrier protein SoxY [Pseudomonadota bacterium]
MLYTRRDLCRYGAALAALAAAGPSLSWASEGEDAVKAAIMAFTGGVMPAEGGVEIGAPEIAENGSTVPVQVAAEGASSILLLASRNPNPDVATFHFGALAGSSFASTRIRLAETQDLVAVAKMADGSFQMASRNVKVTIGGCGG